MIAKTKTRAYTLKGVKRIKCPKCGNLGVLKTRNFTQYGGKITRYVVHTHHIEQIAGWCMSIVDSKCDITNIN